MNAREVFDSLRAPGSYLWAIAQLRNGHPIRRSSWPSSCALYPVNVDSPGPATLRCMERGIDLGFRDQEQAVELRLDGVSPDMLILQNLTTGASHDSAGNDIHIVLFPPTVETTLPPHAQRYFGDEEQRLNIIDRIREGILPYSKEWIPFIKANDWELGGTDG